MPVFQRYIYAGLLEWDNGSVTAAILTVVLVLLVLGDIAAVRAWTRRKRDRTSR
jgi:hypothetical protein